MAEEGLKKTKNDLIHIGCPIPFDVEEFLEELEGLLVAAYKNKDDIKDRVVAVLLAVIYGVRPQFWNNITGLSTGLMLLMLLELFLSPAQQFWLLRQRYEYKYKIVAIAVAGTGYVGLSIATLLSQHHEVMAVDIVPEKVALINQRKSPIQDEYIEKFPGDYDARE